MGRVFLLVILALCQSGKFASSECPVIISEVNIDGPESPNKHEFIELRSTCNASPGGAARTLDAHTLVIWKGPKKASQQAKVQHILPLKGYAFNPGSQYFVIGSQEIIWEIRNQSSVLASTGLFQDLFSPAANEGIKKNPTKGYLDNGKTRSMALVLYRGSVKLSVEQDLTADSAFSSQAADVVIYHEHGNAGMFVDSFFPAYRLPGIEQEHAGILLKDAGKTKDTEDFSISACCSSDMPKWPLGFRRTLMTPGEENKCTDSNLMGENSLKNALLSGTDLVKKVEDLPASMEASVSKAQLNDALNHFNVLVSVFGGLGGLALLVALTGAFVYFRKQSARRSSGRMRLNPVIDGSIDDDDVR